MSIFRKVKVVGHILSVRKLILPLALHLLWGVGSASAQSPASGCAHSFFDLFAGLHPGALQPLPEGATFEAIRSRYQGLRSAAERLEVPLDRASSSQDVRDRSLWFQMNLKRLVNPDDDALLAEDLGLIGLNKFAVPMRGPDYGRSFMSWIRGAGFVAADANGLPLGTSLLKRIHLEACQGMSFHGFEGRRILKLFKDGKITRDEMAQKLKEAYEQDKSVSGVSHGTLVGKFRAEEMDQIIHRGSSMDRKGARYFTASELASVRANRFMKVDESTVQEFEPEKFRAIATYADVKKIEESVDSVFSEAEQALRSAKTVEDQVAVITRMQRDLISIHPFLDGNGRTIRLLGDLLYQRLGLPPPQRPNEKDLEMTAAESFEFARRQMISHLNGWSEKLREVRDRRNTGPAK